MAEQTDLPWSLTRITKVQGKDPPAREPEEGGVGAVPPRVG
jgi:hypothetical protein